MKALKLCKGVLTANKDSYDALVIAGGACSHLLAAQLADIARGEGKEGGPDWMEQSDKALSKASGVEPLRIDAWQALMKLHAGQGECPISPHFPVSDMLLPITPLGLERPVTRAHPTPGERLTDAMCGLYRALQASGSPSWAEQCAEAASRLEGEKRFQESAAAYAELAANSPSADGKIAALGSRAHVLRAGGLAGVEDAARDAVDAWLAEEECEPPSADCFEIAAEAEGAKGAYRTAWAGVRAHRTNAGFYEALLGASWSDTPPLDHTSMSGKNSSTTTSAMERLAARAAMSHPGSARAWVGVGAALCRRGRYAAARPLLEAWAKVAPHDAGSWLALGEAHVNTGAPKSAAKCAAKAQECAAAGKGGMKGAARRGRLLFAECLLRQKLWGEAKDAFQSVLGEEPASAKALEGMGRCCAGAADRAGAKDYFGQALSADPLNHGVLSLLAGMCGEEGRWQKAAEYLKQACDIAPSHAPHRCASLTPPPPPGRRMPPSRPAQCEMSLRCHFPPPC